jgi:hypothetical protein
LRFRSGSPDAVMACLKAFLDSRDPKDLEGDSVPGFPQVPQYEVFLSIPPPGVVDMLPGPALPGPALHGPVPATISAGPGGPSHTIGTGQRAPSTGTEPRRGRLSSGASRKRGKGQDWLDKTYNLMHDHMPRAKDGTFLQKLVLEKSEDESDAGEADFHYHSMPCYLC